MIGIGGTGEQDSLEQIRQSDINRSSMHYNSLQEMQESPDINTSRMEYGGNVNEYDNRSHVSSFKSYQTYIQNPHNSKRPNRKTNKSKESTSITSYHPYRISL